MCIRDSPDGGDPGADELFQTQDVGLRIGRQVLEPAARGDVLPPAGVLLVDRRGVMEVGLVDLSLIHI